MWSGSVRGVVAEWPVGRVRCVPDVVSVTRPVVVVLMLSPVVVDAPVVNDVTDSRDRVCNHIRTVSTRSCDASECESHD
jgi:hypothetical protein